MEKLFEFRDAELGYKKKAVLSGVSLSINKGDFIGLIGPNGAGKTTFLKTLMGLINVRAGVFESFREVRYGYCMQRDFLSNIFPFTVEEIVLMGRTPYCSPFRGYTEDDRKKVAAALERSGIKHLAQSRFYNLSGGQQQRVIIARALVLEPDVLILDEPTIDLDVKGKKEILNLISGLYREKGMTVILVSHELNQVVNFAEKFLFFSGNKAYGIYEKNQLCEKTLSKIFDTEIKLCKVNQKQVVV